VRHGGLLRLKALEKDPGSACGLHGMIPNPIDPEAGYLLRRPFL